MSWMSCVQGVTFLGLGRQCLMSSEALFLGDLGQEQVLQSTEGPLGNRHEGLGGRDLLES